MAWRGLYDYVFDIPLDALIVGVDIPADRDSRYYSAGPYKTPLKAACRVCRLDFVKWLLEHGADPNEHPPKSMTPLECAWSCGAAGTMEERERLVDMLLEAGAIPNRTQYVPPWVDERIAARQHRRAARRALGAILCARGVARDVMRSLFV